MKSNEKRKTYQKTNENQFFRAFLRKYINIVSKGVEKTYKNLLVLKINEMQKTYKKPFKLHKKNRRMQRSHQNRKETNETYKIIWNTLRN